MRRFQRALLALSTAIITGVFGFVVTVRVLFLAYVWWASKIHPANHSMAGVGLFLYGSFVGGVIAFIVCIIAGAAVALTLSFAAYRLSVRKLGQNKSQGLDV